MVPSRVHFTLKRSLVRSEFFEENMKKKNLCQDNFVGEKIESTFFYLFTYALYQEMLTMFQSYLSTFSKLVNYPEFRSNICAGLLLPFS